MRGQRFERFQIILVLRVNGIVPDPRGNERVVAGIVFVGTLHARGRFPIDPQRFHPGVADVAGIRRAGHVGKRAGNGTSISGSEKLPLFESEESEFVDADEKKFGPLILVNVVFTFAVAEARGRAVPPGDDVLRVVVGAVEFARNVAAEVEKERGFELGKCAAKKKRVRAVMLVRLENRFHQQRFRSSRAGRAAEKAIFGRRVMKFLLLRKRLVRERERRAVIFAPAIDRGFDGGRHGGFADGAKAVLRKCGAATR